LIDLGTVRPGSTIYIPFATFAGSTGSPITMTGLATSDILIYKDGGTTERASAAGITLLDTDGIDFDAKTGIHGVSIDLADNTTADFYAAGSRYFVVIGDITVDSQTVRFVAATFRIGYPGAIHDTTIATLASQTSFTLTAGPADNNALIGCPVVIHDAASAAQMAVGFVSAYTGSTKTVTLAADPAIFTMAAKDNISIFLPANVRAFGGTTVTGRDIGASVLLSSGTGTGQISLSSGTVSLTADQAVNVTKWGGTAVASATVRADLINIAGSAVSTSTAQLGVNVVNYGGSAGTFSGGRPEVKLGNVAHGGAAATLALGGAGGYTGAITGSITGNLSGSVGSVTGAVGSVTGAVGSVTGSVGSIATGGIAAASFAAGAIDAAAIAADAIGASELAADAVAEIADAVWDEVQSGHTSAGTFGKYLDAQVSAAASPPSAASIADAVWDEAISGHLTAGSTGNALNAAGSAGDPWSTSLPGAYGAGTAGKLIGDNINATISSRSSHSAADVWAAATRTLTTLSGLTVDANLVTILGDAVTTSTDPINANVVQISGDSTAADNLESACDGTGYNVGAGQITVANGGGLDAAGVRAAVGLATANLDTQLGAIDDYIDTEVAAIKAKTDMIPASPAATGDIPTTAAIADKVLGRSIAGGADGGRTVKQALQSLRNKTVISGGTLTVYAEDDTASSWTAAVTTDAAADPITGVDPA
jgi:hypothetical protein